MEWNRPALPRGEAYLHARISQDGLNVFFQGKIFAARAGFVEDGYSPFGIFLENEKSRSP